MESLRLTAVACRAATHSFAPNMHMNKFPHEVQAPSHEIPEQPHSVQPIDNDDGGSDIEKKSEVIGGLT